MKKIFTILLAAGTVTFASAQSKESWGHDQRGNSRDVVYGQSNSNVYRNNTNDYNSYSFDLRNRDEQIQKINWEFDQKIKSVKRDRHLRFYEKSGQIQMLERQREEQIREVQMHFSGTRDKHDDNRFNTHKW